MKAAIDIIWLILKLIYYSLESFCKLFSIPRKKDISGRTVLITGGGGGLGKQLAIQFAKHGTRIVICDIDLGAAEMTASIVRSMKSDALAYSCDCSDEAEVAKLAKQISYDIGPIDILVNNAGILNGKSLLMLSTDDIKKTFRVNVFAHFWTLKAFLPDMMEKNEGHVVTIASSSGLHGTPNLSDYSASKFALMGLHESVALEMREKGLDGIKFTVVCPNFINTGMSWYPKTNLPWLLPILDVEDVAKTIVDSVRTNKELLILPKTLEILNATKGLVTRKGQLAVYDWTGLGIDPHVPKRKSQLSRKVK